MEGSGKIVSLVIFYNGAAAVSLGFLAGLVPGASSLVIDLAIFWRRCGVLSLPTEPKDARKGFDPWAHPSWPCFHGAFLGFAGMLPGVLVPFQSREALYIPVTAVLLFGLAVAYPGVSIMRRYFRELDAMRQQLLSISFSTACSSCCALDHVGPSGEAIPCDRKILKECVTFLVWQRTNFRGHHSFRGFGDFEHL